MTVRTFADRNEHSILRIGCASLLIALFALMIVVNFQEMSFGPLFVAAIIFLAPALALISFEWWSRKKQTQPRVIDTLGTRIGFIRCPHCRQRISSPLIDVLENGGQLSGSGGMICAGCGAKLRHSEIERQFWQERRHSPG